MRAYQTVLYRIILQKNPFFTQFLAKFLSKIFQIIISLYFFLFCNLKKIKSNSLVTVWNALGLSHQTTVSLSYSQSIKINIGPSDGGTIISSSRRPTVLNQRLTEFRIQPTCTDISQFKMLMWGHTKKQQKQNPRKSKLLSSTKG